MAASRLVKASVMSVTVWVAATAAALALVIAVLAMLREGAADAAASTPATTRGEFRGSSEAGAKPSPARPSVTTHATPPTPLPAVDLAHLLRAAGSDLRASITAALGAREAGGRLYARALARPCAALAALNAAPVAEGGPPGTAQADGNDPVHQRALFRKQAWEAGCAQLPASEWMALMNVAPNEPGVPDPLLTLTEGSLASVADAQAARARLKSVMAKPDGLLLDEIGTQLLRREAGGYRFDGRVYASDEDQRAMEAALRLLPCEFGMACGEQDPAVWMACLQGEGCFTSRQEQVLASAAAGDGQRAAEILALRDRLREAVKRQSVERF